MQKVITLTINPTIDKSTSVESVASEIKLRCEAPQFDPGGGGLNVSRAIKTLGGESTAVYTAGGGIGEMLGYLLAREGITTRPIPIRGLTRENLTVYEHSSNLQYRFGMPGPELAEAEWQRCLDVVFELDADYIVASGSLAPGVPDDFYAYLAERAQNSSRRVIVDTSGTALQALRNTGVFLLKPNLRELEQLSGEAFAGEAELKNTAQAMIHDGLAQVMVISMGASGAAFITATEYICIRPPVVPIRSKVGAGDSMVGGIIWALSNDESLLNAVRYGIAAGTAAVMTEGTQLCRKDDVLALYEQVIIHNN